MEEGDSIKRFVSLFIASQGGVAEYGEDGSIRGLITEDLASELGTGEEIELGGEDFPLVYGNPLLDRMIRKATDYSPVVYASITSDYLKKGGFEQILRRDLSFPDCLPAIRGTAAARTVYMILTAHYEAISDERKDGQVQVAVQERTGANVEEFLDKWLSHHPAYFKPGGLPPHFPRDVEKAVDAALAVAKEKAHGALKEFVLSMERRLRRDIGNTREYYDALKKEMEEGLLHPSPREAQREERKAKIAELPREAIRKIEDLRQKYQIRVRIKASAAVRVLTDVVQLMVNANYRKNTRDIILFWNPVTQALDPVVCEACGRTIRKAFFREQGSNFLLVCQACRG